MPNRRNVLAALITATEANKRPTNTSDIVMGCLLKRALVEVSDVEDGDIETQIDNLLRYELPKNIPFRGKND